MLQEKGKRPAVTPDWKKNKQNVEELGSCYPNQWKEDRGIAIHLEGSKRRSLCGHLHVKPCLSWIHRE